MSGEESYLQLLRDLLIDGNSRTDRTGTGTLSLFGKQMRFDISTSVPLLTTKYVKWTSVLEELLWFLRGETDSKTLEQKGISIWKQNTSREFLDKRGLESYEEGDIGPMYGYQWRHWGRAYGGGSVESDSGIDQIAEVIETLRTDPFSRRIIMSSYNVQDRNKGVLYPCHGIVVQFYCRECRECSGKRHLSCHMYQRSMDTFLGAPYNIFSYSLLTYIIATKVDMVPDELIISIGDAHLYKDHLEQANTQVERIAYAFPTLVVDPAIKDMAWQDISVAHFQVEGYKHHPYIKATMSA